jgi:hypothetical protein
LLEAVSAFAERLAIRAIGKAAVFVVAVGIVIIVAVAIHVTVSIAGICIVIGVGISIVVVVVVVIASSSNPLTPLTSVPVTAADRQEAAAVISELL